MCVSAASVDIQMSWRGGNTHTHTRTQGSNCLAHPSSALSWHVSNMPMLADLSAICWALKVSKSTVFCAPSALFCFLSDLDMDLEIQSDVFDMLSAVLTVSANALSHTLCSNTTWCTPDPRPLWCTQQTFAQITLFAFKAPQSCELVICIGRPAFLIPPFVCNIVKGCGWFQQCAASS